MSPKSQAPGWSSLSALNESLRARSIAPSDTHVLPIRGAGIQVEVSGGATFADVKTPPNIVSIFKIEKFPHPDPRPNPIIASHFARAGGHIDIVFGGQWRCGPRAVNAIRLRNIDARGIRWLA
jgi:hypothetical protein